MSNFWQKLGLGLKKSSDKISGGLSDIFSKKKLDSASLAELEDLLLISDMGVKASSEYGKTCSLCKPASVTNLHVFSKALIVSVGNPQMKSALKTASGRISFIFRHKAITSSRLCRRPIRFNIRLSPD